MSNIHLDDLSNNELKSLGHTEKEIQKIRKEAMLLRNFQIDRYMDESEY